MTNPYLQPVPPAPVFEALPTDPIVGDALHMTGLTNPQAARGVIDAPAPTDVPVVTPDTVWLVGASGGVGVSTLANLAGDLVVDGGPFPPPWGSPTYIVAATHPAGLTAATELARAKARGEIPYDVLGLLLVHDRPKLSKSTIQLARSVAGLYPRTLPIPFMQAWREPDTTRETNIRIRRAIASLTTARSTT